MFVPFFSIQIFYSKKWLQAEALQENPKIDVSDDKMRFSFKPVFKLKDSKSLLKLLKQYDLKGLGGILLEEIQESLPHCEKVLKKCEEKIIYIIRPTDKKKILFYNDQLSKIGVRFIELSISDFSFSFLFLTYFS